MANKTFDVRIKQKYDTLENFRAENAVYLKSELLFAQDDKDISIYLADGVTPFNELVEIFSSKWVFGRSEVTLEPVELKANAWTSDGTQIVQVPGINAVESEQLIVPTYSAGSRQVAMSCGIDFIVLPDGKIEFTCDKIPTDDILLYFGLFGKKSDNDDTQPIIRTDIDSTLSSVSTNPVENKAITTKIDSIEASIRSITGGESGSEDSTSLSSINTKLNNAVNYTTESKIKIGTYNGQDNYRQMLTYSVSVSYASLEADSDIGIMVVPNHTLTFTDLSNVYWSGKTESGEFYGNFPCRVTSDGKIQMINVPVGDEPYNLSGYIVIEGTNFTLSST